VTVVVNGRPWDLPEGSTVDDALARMGERAQQGRVAVACNGEVGPRREWARTPLADGDHLEVVAAIQGGSR
jgi:sulfur carrier protein